MSEKRKALEDLIEDYGNVCWYGDPERMDIIGKAIPVAIDELIAEVRAELENPRTG